MSRYQDDPESNSHPETIPLLAHRPSASPRNGPQTRPSLIPPTLIFITTLTLSTRLFRASYLDTLTSIICGTIGVDGHCDSPVVQEELALETY